MKNAISTLLFVITLGATAQAQKVKEANVPAAVKEAFTKMYPSANHVEWEMEGTNYEAEFDNNKTETSVEFTSTGNLVFTEVEIQTSELPAAALTYLNTNCAGKKVKEATKITDAAGVMTYEAEVDGADYIFDTNGQFLKKIEEKEEGDHDEKNKK